MKNIRFNRVLQIVYPVLVYFILNNILNGLFVYILPENTYRLIPLLLAGFITIWPVLYIYRKVPVVKNPNLFVLKDLPKDVLCIFLVVLTGLLFNVIITRLSLVETSAGFNNATKVLLDGNIWIKIACNVIVIPILEELVYRGIVEGQLLLWHGPVLATVFSSFCFGILHLNIVQFLYAFIVGLVLGFAYYKTNKLWVCVAGHGLTNLLVILLT